MPAQTAGNAWERAVQIILVPSGVILIAVALTKAFYGSIVAGIVLNIATLLVLVGVAGAATYWHTEYTGIIAVGGTGLVFLAPSIFSAFVHPALATLNQMFFIGFLLYIWFIFLRKVGFELG